MHTFVKLDNGILTTRVVSEVTVEVSKNRWRAAIAPAIVFLRSLGGGDLCVIHRPTDFDR